MSSRWEENLAALLGDFADAGVREERGRGLQRLLDRFDSLANRSGRHAGGDAPKNGRRRESVWAAPDFAATRGRPRARGSAGSRAQACVLLFRARWGRPGAARSPPRGLRASCDKRDCAHARYSPGL